MGFVTELFRNFFGRRDHEPADRGNLWTRQTSRRSCHADRTDHGTRVVFDRRADAPQADFNLFVADGVAAFAHRAQIRQQLTEGLDRIRGVWAQNLNP